MAMVKKSSLAADKQGKQGGNVFRIDQCGEHIQAKPRYIPGASEKQSAARRRFRKSLTFCRGFMTTEKANEWMTYSFRHPKKDKKGKVWSYNPIMACMAVNIPRLKAGLDMTDTPPTD